MKTLVIGGARSGKSAWAETQAAGLDLPVTVIVTAQASDAEMEARIAHHRAQRPAHWQVVEAPLALADVLACQARPDRVVIVDCMTLWLAQMLFPPAQSGPEGGILPLPPLFVQQRERLLYVLESVEGPLFLVSNETGLGIVPMGAGNRLFVDEAGRLNQQLARVCERVVFMAAGLPLALKGELP